MYALWSSLRQRRRPRVPARPVPPRPLGPMLRDGLYLGIGVTLATLGLRAFLIPNRFIDGGVTGVALLLQEAAHVPVSVSIVVLNLPFLWLARQVLGATFALRAAVAMVAFALAVAVVDVPAVTQDRLLVAVFGGMLVGSGIGLAIRGGGAIDGTEVLAIHVSRRLRTTVGDVITLLNVLIFSVAAWVFTLESALYSVLTYFAAAKTVDFLLDGIDEFTAVVIVSRRSAAIRRAIVEDLGRGVTVLHGSGGQARSTQGKQVEVLYTVVTRLEVAGLTRVLDAIDPTAFVTMHRLRDIRGGVVKKRVAALEKH